MRVLFLLTMALWARSVAAYPWHYAQGQSVGQTLLLSAIEVNQVGSQTTLSRYEVKVEAEVTLLEVDQDRLLLSLLLYRIEPTYKSSPSLEEADHLLLPFNLDESVEDWSYWRRQRQLRSALRHPLLFVVNQQGEVSLVEEGLEERFSQFPKVLSLIKEKIAPWLLRDQFALRSQAEENNTFSLGATSFRVERGKEDQLIVHYESQSPCVTGVLSWQKPSLFFTLDEVCVETSSFGQLLITRRITSK